MIINKNLDNNDLTVEIIGRLDTNTYNELEESIKDDLVSINNLIFDFRDLEYLSSAGLRTLVSTHKKLIAENKTMKIINVNNLILDIFEVSGINKILNIE